MHNTFHPRKLPHQHHITMCNVCSTMSLRPWATICHVMSMSSMSHHGTTTMCPHHVFHVITLSHVCHVNARSPMPGHQFATLVPHQCSMLASNPNYPKMCGCAHPTPPTRTPLDFHTLNSCTP